MQHVILRRLLVLGVVFALLGASVPALAAVRSSDRVCGTAVSAMEGASSADDAPDLEMASGYLGTVEGRELWSRDADKRRPMASTTKIMTAVIVLESDISLDEEVTVSAAAARVGQARYNLKAGDVLTAGELLEQMLVKSGNDAASALAEHVGGSESEFVQMMNDKAEELGLADTHYRNPHGLDDEDHYTTARDLAALARYAMREPEFQRIVKLPSVTVRAGGREERMENTNALLDEVDGMVGIKTGMTDDAGWCLVSQVERGPLRLLSVVLGTKGETSRITQSKELLDWGFEHYTEVTLASAAETMGLVPVGDYLDVAVPARIEEAITAPLFDLDGEIRRTLKLEPNVRAPVHTGSKVGTLLIYQGERLVAEVPVRSARAVPVPGLGERVRIWLVRAWRSVFGNGNDVRQTAPGAEVSL